MRSFLFFFWQLHVTTYLHKSGFRISSHSISSLLQCHMTVTCSLTNLSPPMVHRPHWLFERQCCWAHSTSLQILKHMQRCLGEQSHFAARLLVPETKSKIHNKHHAALSSNCVDVHVHANNHQLLTFQVFEEVILSIIPPVHVFPILKHPELIPPTWSKRNSLMTIFITWPTVAGSMIATFFSFALEDTFKQLIIVKT